MEETSSDRKFADAEYRTNFENLHRLQQEHVKLSAVVSQLEERYPNDPTIELTLTKLRTEMELNSKARANIIERNERIKDIK